MRLYDAHNHLQDERFGGCQDELVATCRAVGVVRMVVNGACESDWPHVADLARRHPDLVKPSFGYHPWCVGERTGRWREVLERYLETTPGAVIGEIGLDRWKPGLVYEPQEGVFAWQLAAAADRDLPVSIHCLRAWGRLVELLRSGRRPVRGFLLHSYGGPIELVSPLAALGAYFSLPGACAHPRKERQRQAFRAVPPDRLLLETDAPDQRGPEPTASLWGQTKQLPSGSQAKEIAASREEAMGSRPRKLVDPATGQELNHPASIAAVYAFAADLFQEPIEVLAERVEANFLRLFS